MAKSPCLSEFFFLRKILVTHTFEETDFLGCCECPREDICKPPKLCNANVISTELLLVVPLSYSLQIFFLIVITNLYLAFNVLFESFMCVIFINTISHLLLSLCFLLLFVFDIQGNSTAQYQ